MGRVVIHPPGGEAEKPFVVGAYEGDDTAERLINLGFAPSAVLVLREGRFETAINASSNVGSYGGLALADCPAYSDVSGSSQRAELLRVTDDGFKVFQKAPAYTNKSPLMFYYIAFR